MKLPGIWLPVDFYVSCSGTQERTLHVPERVVDVWAESQGVKQKSMVLKVRLVVHLTVIVDLQLSRNLKLRYGFITGPKGWPAPIPRRQPPDQSKSDRHAPHNCHAAGYQPNGAGNRV